MKCRHLIALATTLSLVVAGCGGSSSGQDTESLPASAAEAGGLDALVEKAQEEGEVSLYAGTTESSTREWAQAFEDEYGIEVKLYRDGSTTLFQKWAQEVQGGVDNADVVIQNVVQLWDQAQAESWITPYETESFDEYDFDRFFSGGDLTGSVYTLHQSIGAVVWNTDVVTPEQQALLEQDPVAALADPAFRGQVALGDFGGATSAGNVAGIVLDQADEYGWPWLEAVAANDPAIFESQVPIAEQLVKGEYAATFATDTLYNSYIEQGAPIQYAYPEPTNSAVWMMALPTDAPHPYAARLFVEWASSAEGHDLMAELGTGAGTRTGWVDERTVADQPWYQEPDPWYGFATLPELQGEGLGEFVTKVNDTIG